MAKLTAEERKASIIQAVRCLFANSGFNGTTTRELAEAAGVSEALLFRHFPNKEALFEAIQQSFCDDQARARFDRLTALEPSTNTLVLLVHFLVSSILGRGHSDADRAMHSRMVLRSMAENGELARSLVGPFEAIFIPKIEECLQAAVEAGDATCEPVIPSLGGWFAYNLASMAAFQSVPTPPVVRFGMLSDRLASQIVWFALRGLGVKEDVIRRHYQPEALTILGVS